MARPNKLHYAIVCALAAGSYSGALIAQENTDKEQGEKAKQLATMEVTASKTEKRDMQEMAIAVDAVGEIEIKELNIGNFDDLSLYQPNLTQGSRGPGQATVYLRGMAIQPITVLLSAAQGTSPNVALYVDEQPVSAPGRNLDVYSTDLERIEVLPGPQGTLFGASSQAGTIRYITNKPRLLDFDAGFSVDFSATEEGDPSTGVEGFLNLPFGENAAMRVAFYNIHEGGYIDNVAGEFTLDPAINPESSVDLGPDAIYTTANNQLLVEEDFNDSNYRGVRIGGLYSFSPDWSLNLQHHFQELEADGVFDYDPDVGDLEVQRFFPDALEDDFNQTTWTLEGRLAQLDMVYTGGYLEREIQQSVDYTGYNNAGGFIAYYTCTYDNPNYIVNYGINPDVITDVRTCLDPSKGAIINQDHERFTHEFRVSTPQDQRLRFVGGIFYDDLTIETQDDYYYFVNMEGGGAALGFAPNAPISGANNINPNARPPQVAFFNDITRSEEQIALFGEVTYDITDTVSATLGLRYYDIESDFTGSSNFANSIFSGSVDLDSGRDYDVSGGHSTEPLSQDDLVPKLTVSWNYSDDMLFYTTYSEGFRPGGWNRGGGLTSINPDFPTVNTTYETDDVKNYELGWKTMFADNTVRWNGNLYHIDWTDMQVSRFDPVNVSILTFIENAADSEITGFETDLSWRATDNLTLFGALSYNDTELTAVNAQVIELAPVGSELPLVPELQATARVRYDWFVSSDWADYAHWQIDARYADESFSSIIAEERRKQDSYAVANASVGMTRGSWSATLYAENLFDERAELFINTQDDVPRITTNRPRTVGLKLSYSY